jgi:hypothetical protein
MKLAIFLLLAAAAHGQDWVSLFDGKTLKGWDARTTFSKDATGDWSVANGAIRCPGKTPGWLSTSAAYSDFVLTLEFRGSEKVNSGVFLRSQKEGEPHKTGYELQIWEYQPAGFLTGSLVGTAKAGPANVKGDAWNRYEITARGDRIQVVLNGAKVLDVRDNKHLSGVIGFQCQVDNPIEFRDIRLKPLR